MLDLLKQFHDTPLNTPSRAQRRPDPDRFVGSATSSFSRRRR